MLRFTYPGLVQAIGGEYLVTFRDIPEAVTCGWTRESALNSASEALATALSEYIETGRQVPDPTPPHVHEVLVRLPHTAAAALILRREMLQRGLSKLDLADKLGKNERHVHRILSGNGSLDHSVSALEALGVQVQMTVSPNDQSNALR